MAPVSETPEDRSAVQLGARSAADLVSLMPAELREDVLRLLADGDRVNRLLESRRSNPLDNLDDVLREIHRQIIEAQELTERQHLRPLRSQASTGCNDLPPDGHSRD